MEDQKLVQVLYVGIRTEDRLVNIEKNGFDIGTFFSGNPLVAARFAGGILPVFSFRCESKDLNRFERSLYDGELQYKLVDRPILRSEVHLVSHKVVCCWFTEDEYKYNNNIQHRRESAKRSQEQQKRFLTEYNLA